MLSLARNFTARRFAASLSTCTARTGGSRFGPERTSSAAAGAFVAFAAAGTAFAASEEQAPRKSGSTVSILANLEKRLAQLESAGSAPSGAAAEGGAGGAAPVRAPPTVDVVLGAQWGDEGKGKLVDAISAQYSACARVAGGGNAGHTIVVGDKKYSFHLLPSGLLNPSSTAVIGHGVVVHVKGMLAELDKLKAAGVDVESQRGRLILSDRAHLVFDFHQQADGAAERLRGKGKIGTTKKGIGPTVCSKMMRNGLRVCDLVREGDDGWASFERRFRELAAYHQALPGMQDVTVDVEGELAFLKAARSRVRALTVDTVEWVHDAVDSGSNLLVEGANATMLDIDYGTYPYVTSSNPSIGSALTGLGIHPAQVRHIFGIVKAYCTRVGEGPFPTEEDGTAVGKHLATVGHEYGTTTARPRRCGWLDTQQMRYSAQLNGFTALNLTKLDVLTGIEKLRVGVRYVKPDGTEVRGMPAHLDELAECTVEYEEFDGWQEDISSCRSFDQLPAAAQKYVLRVEELIGVPIKWIGTGAARDDMIERDV